MPTGCICRRASQYGPSTGGAAAREFGKRLIRDAQHESWQRQASLLRAFNTQFLWQGIAQKHWTFVGNVHQKGG